VRKIPPSSASSSGRAGKSPDFVCPLQQRSWLSPRLRSTLQSPPATAASNPPRRGLCGLDPTPLRLARPNHGHEARSNCLMFVLTCTGAMAPDPHWQDSEQRPRPLSASPCSARYPHPLAALPALPFAAAVPIGDKVSTPICLRQPLPIRSSHSSVNTCAGVRAGSPATPDAIGTIQHPPWICSPC
jgi:hypothetical protein